MAPMDHVRASQALLSVRGRNVLPDGFEGLFLEGCEDRSRQVADAAIARNYNLAIKEPLHGGSGEIVDPDRTAGERPEDLFEFKFGLSLVCVRPVVNADADQPWFSASESSWAA